MRAIRASGGYSLCDATFSTFMRAIRVAKKTIMHRGSLSIGVKAGVWKCPSPSNQVQLVGVVPDGVCVRHLCVVVKSCTFVYRHTYAQWFVLSFSCRACSYTSGCVRAISVESGSHAGGPRIGGPAFGQLSLRPWASRTCSGSRLPKSSEPRARGGRHGPLPDDLPGRRCWRCSS